MKRYYQFIVDSADHMIADFIQNQQLDPSNPNFGGYKQILPAARHNIYMMSTSVAAYFNPQSKYYKSPLLKERLLLSAEFVKNIQRPDDGTFDLPGCNFRSTPDTGFHMKRMCYAYKLIAKFDKDGELTELSDRMYAIMCAAANALITGGFHTPNHRWGIAASLMTLSHLIKDKDLAARCLARCNEYLLEGIDASEDGEYSERSTGNYNAVVNTSMIMFYEETGDEKYLEYVDKNLTMMLTMIEPDGTVFTENSTRQDNGKIGFPIKYFYQFVYMAGKSKTHGKQFGDFAAMMVQQAMDRLDYSIDCLHNFMLYDFMKDVAFTGSGLPETYTKYYPYSGMARVKKGDMTYSLLKGSDKFLFFRNNGTRVGLRITAVYFNYRNFKADTVTQTEDGFIMEYRAQGWYYLPFGKKQESSDWWQMDNTKREKLLSNYQRIVITVKNIENGISVNLKSDGIDRAPIRLEFSFSADGHIEMDNCAFTAASEENMLLKSGGLTYTKDGDTLRLDGGFADVGMYGGGYASGVAGKGQYVVCCTAVTNFDKTFTITTK